MKNKEMRKEFEIWAKENCDLMLQRIEGVEEMFEVYKGNYNLTYVRVGYQVFKKLKEESSTEKTKPIWTWEDKIAGRLPEVGAIVLGSLDCECVILGADIKDRTVVVQYQDGQLQKLNIHYINPVETPQEKYNREMEEYVKAIADKDPESRYSIYDFKEGVKAAYKQFKPFQEDKKD